VPTWLLIVICLPLPILLITAFAWLRYYKHRDAIFAKMEALTAIGALLLASGISTFFTSIIKHLVGRPRPNFIAYCHWLAESGCGNPTPDAWASFVSGHSSLSFACMGILSLYFLTVMRAAHRSDIAAGKNPTPDCLGACAEPRFGFEELDHAAISRRVELSTQADNAAWIYCVCALPLILAGWIACTRIVDYWHNTDDVLGGSILGIGCAFMVGRFKLKNFETMLPVALAPPSPVIPLRIAEGTSREVSSPSSDNMV